MAGRWDTLKVDDSEMRCYVALPEGEGPYPGVLVCMHAPGLDGFIQGIGDRLASAGMAGIAPDLYHRQDEPAENPMQRMAQLRDPSILRDLDAASGHLRDLDEVSAGQSAVIGFCMGGRLAYLFSAHDAAVRVSVVFYGGNIMRSWGDGPTPFDKSAEIDCPVLGLFGAEDRNPSPEDVASIDAELTRVGVEHEFHSFDGAGHAFLNEGRPSYRKEAAADAWRRCEAFLKHHLGLGA